MKIPSSLRTAFTLVEMLVVVAIIGIIATFTIPAASKMIRGTDVTRAAQMVSDQFSQGRLTAVSRNKQIEIRFLKFADPEQPGEDVNNQSSWKIRGMQLMEVTASGFPVQLGPMQRLPGTMLLHDGKYSSLIDSTNTEPGQKALEFKNPTALDPPMPRVAVANARKYTYAAFRFLPDGSTNLAVKGKWYVTMLSAADKAKMAAAADGSSTDPIKTVNYFTVQIDPVSGASRTYRPSLGSS